MKIRCDAIRYGDIIIIIMIIIIAIIYQHVVQ
jgi:hypothetical protein